MQGKVVDDDLHFLPHIVEIVILVINRDEALHFSFCFLTQARKSRLSDEVVHEGGGFAERKIRIPKNIADTNSAPPTLIN